MTSAEIRASIAEAQERKDKLTEKLSIARRRAAKSGDYRDNHWFTAKEAEERALGRRIGQLQAQLGEACRAERAAAHAPVSADANTETERAIWAAAYGAAYAAHTMEIYPGGAGQWAENSASIADAAVDAWYELESEESEPEAGDAA